MSRLALAACALLLAVGGVNAVAAQAAGDNIVRDETTGASYADLSEALSAARAGDTLTVLSDAKAAGSLSCDKNLTLDLAGHVLIVDATQDKAVAADVEADGINVETGAAFTVSDSSSGNAGKLKVQVGSKNEVAKRIYAGIDVSGGGTFSLDDADLDVGYAGVSLALPAVTLHGVSLETGSFAATGSSALSVSAAPKDRAFGAQEASGIWASADSTGSISVGADARIDVDNNARPVSADTPDYPDYVGATGAQSSTNATLVEVKVEEGSEFDRVLQEAFRANASLDASADKNGSVYDANIYYVTALKLSNGMTVWAYSDQVADSDIGKISSIVAKHVFVRAACANPQSAYGICAESGFSGAVDWQGSSKVTTTAGDAVALYAKGSSSGWGYDEQKLEVSCDGAPYTVATGKHFNLNDYETIGGYSNQIVVYPQRSNLYEARAVQPQARKVVSGTLEQEDGSVTESNVRAALYSAMDSEVTVAFTGMRDASGAALSDVEQAVAYGKTLKEVGAQEPSSATYAQGGTRYCFVGWKLAGVSSVYAYDADSVYAGTPMTSSVNGVTKGQVTYTAQYCEVPEGEHLVTFRIEDELFAYAVEDGTAPSYVEARGLKVTQQNSGTPEKVTTEDGYSYEFAGWKSGADDESIVQDGETLLTDNEIPAATADAGYTARFTKEVQGVMLSLRYKRLANGAFEDTTKVLGDVSWQESALRALDEYASIGAVSKARGVIYTFAGWSPRESDKEPLYSGDFYLAPGTSTWAGDSETLYAVYTTADQYVNVTFHSSGNVLGKTVSVPASTTIKEALAQAGVQEKGITPSGANQELRGWNTTEDARNILTTSTSTVGAVGDYAESIDVYAIWGAKRYVVTFYDSDKKTKFGAFYVVGGSTVEDSNNDFDIELTGQKKDTFEGWVTKRGKAFSTSETRVNADTDVFAKYKTYATGTGSVAKGSGTGASTSGAVKIKSSGPSAVARAVNPAQAARSGSAVQALKAAKAKASSVSGAAAQTPAAASGASRAADAVGQGDEGTLASRIALAVVIAVFLAVVVFIVLWFRRRRVTVSDDAPEDLEPTGMERIRF